MRAPANLDQALSRFTEHWSPKVVGTMNDSEIKVVKVQGEFAWHSHDDTDEVFLVLSGELTIDLDGEPAVVLRHNDLFTVPRGQRHRPRAVDEVTLLLIEPAGVVNTGEAGGPLTAARESYLTG